MQKLCKRCQQTKDISEFHRDKGAKDGHSASCAVCRNAAKREFVEKVRHISAEDEMLPWEINEAKYDFYSIVDELFQKHSFLNFTLSSRGPCRLQCMGSMPHSVYKAENMRALMKMVAEREGL